MFIHRRLQGLLRSALRCRVKMNQPLGQAWLRGHYLDGMVPFRRAGIDKTSWLCQRVSLDSLDRCLQVVTAVLIKLLLHAAKMRSPRKGYGEGVCILAIPAARSPVRIWSQTDEVRHPRRIPPLCGCEIPVFPNAPLDLIGIKNSFAVHLLFRRSCVAKTHVARPI